MALLSQLFPHQQSSSRGPGLASRLWRGLGPSAAVQSVGAFADHCCLEDLGSMRSPDLFEISYLAQLAQAAALWAPCPEQV